MVNTMFVEKYRPKTLDMIVGQPHIIPLLQGFVKNKDIPHILFNGPAGCGKTTTAQALARELYGKEWKNYFLELNASDSRKLEDVRTKIKDSARIKVIGQDFKIIFLDEVDSMDRLGQNALRRIIEQTSDKCRFILSCVTPNTKILLPEEIEITIKEFMKKFDNKELNKIKNFDLQKISLRDESIVTCIKLNPKIIGKKVLRIETMTGRKLVVTEDHKLLTSEGWKESGTITQNDKLLVYPHLEGTYFESNNNQIIKIEDFINFLTKTEEKKSYKNIEEAKRYRDLKTMEKYKIISRINELKLFIENGNGLTKKEWYIYKNLRKNEKITIREIQKTVSLSRGRIGDLLKSLEEKKLIFRYIDRNNTHYFVTNKNKPVVVRNLMDIKNIIEKEYKISISYTGVENAFNKNIVHGRVDRVVKTLNQKNLLNLTYNSEKIGPLTRVVAFIFGDGHIHKTDTAIIFSGNEIALKNVKKDLKILGFKSSKIMKTKIGHGTLTGRIIKGTSTQFVLWSKPFSFFLQYLGVPKGDKTASSYFLPDFVKNGTKFVKREFLRSFFGCEGDKPSYKRCSFGAITVGQSKIVDLKDNMLNFLNDLKVLLKKFDVDSYIKIRDNKVIRQKDLKKVYSFSLFLKSSNKNLYNFFNQIGYAYEDYKIRLSRLASEYLKYKFFMIELQKRKAQLIKSKIKEGKSCRKIAQLLDCSPDFVVSQMKERPIHLPRNNFLLFEDWINKYENGCFIENEINEIKEIKCNDVRDITCFHYHNFISNGFISHNCNWPNKIIEPIKDRCVIFRFRHIKPEDMTIMLKRIAREESIDITPSAIMCLAVLSNGSMRRALNTLNQLKLSNITNINDEVIYNNSCYVDDNHVRTLLVAVKKGNIETVDSFMDKLLNEKTYTPFEIIESLRRLIKGSKVLSQKAKIGALMEIGNVDFRIMMGATADIQLKTYAVYLMDLYQKEVK